MKLIFSWISIISVGFVFFIQSSLPAMGESKLTESSVSETQQNAVSQLPEFDYNNVKFWQELCTTLEQAKQYSEAVAACQRAIELKPKRKNLETWMSLGNSLQQLKQYPQALVSYNYLLQREPKYSQVLVHQCEIFLALDQYEKAINTCEKAIKIDGIWGRSSPAEAWKHRAIALGKLGKLEVAELEGLGQQNVAKERENQRIEDVINSYSQALKITPNSSFFLTKKCGLLIEIERYTEALENCELAIAVNENWETTTPAQALEHLLVARQEVATSDPLLVINSAAEAEEIVKQLQNLVRFYEKILADNPDNAQAWTKQGIALQTLGQTERALTSYSRAIEIQPNYSLALVNQCELLNQLEQYESALKACEAALEEDLDWGDMRPAMAWNQRSTALAGLERYNDALGSANRAVALDEDYAEAWNNRGVILWHLGQLQQAQQQYELAELNYRQGLQSTHRAVKINPSYARGWYNHGRILSEYGQLLSLQRQNGYTTEKTMNVLVYKASVEAYQQALAGNFTPKDNLFKASIFANQAVVLWRLRDPQLLTLALEATQQAVQLNPKSFEGWHNRGLILLELRQYQSALNAYTQADALSPENVGVITGKGIALSRLGRYQDALANFEQALKLDPEYNIARKEREIVLQNLIKKTEQTRS